MQARIERRYTTFADYPRFEYILRVGGELIMLDNLFLGLTLDEVESSLGELNDNRQKLGLDPIIVRK